MRRPLTPSTTRSSSVTTRTVRAFKDDVLAHFGNPLIDVRSPEEYSGERTDDPGLPGRERPARRPHSHRAERAVGKAAAEGRARSRRRTELEAIYRDAGRPEATATT